MPDVWSTVAQLNSVDQERLADVLETRGANARQQEMRTEFLSEIDFPEGAFLLEVGCGTGVLTRVLASRPEVASIVGVDPASSLLARAVELSREFDNVRYQEADGRSLPFDNETFDVVIFDSTLCHVPGPEAALAESFRVLRPGGHLAAFDGDYATATVALVEHDPLQICVDAMMANSVNDRWLVRRLPALIAAAGFAVGSFRGHSFIETTDCEYLLTVIDRGADILQAADALSEDTGRSLKAEARRRVESGTFFGHINYGSIIARKP